MVKCFNEAIVVTHTQGRKEKTRVCYQIKFAAVIQPRIRSFFRKNSFILQIKKLLSTLFEQKQWHITRHSNEFSMFLTYLMYVVCVCLNSRAENSLPSVIVRKSILLIAQN